MHQGAIALIDVDESSDWHRQRAFSVARPTRKPLKTVAP
jgi:hypothetical protein